MIQYFVEQIQFGKMHDQDYLYLWKPRELLYQDNKKLVYGDGNDEVGVVDSVFGGENYKKQ